MPQYQTTAKGKRVEPGSPEYDWDKPYTSFDPVADAKSFLSEQSQSREPWTANGKADVAAEVSRMPASSPPPMSLRGLTDIMESAALPVAGMGMIPSPMSPFLLGTSGVLGGAGGLRKMIAPEEDESRIEGGIQAGLSALPAVGPAMRGLGKIGQLPMKRFPISGEKAYRMGEPTGASGLNEQPKSIQALIDMVAGSKSPAAPASATANLPESWKQFASTTTPTVAKSPAKIKRTPAGMLSKMGRESEAGYRNVPHSDNPMLDLLPEGGMSTITPAEWTKLGLRQVREDIPAYLDESAPWSDDLLEQLSQRTARQGIPVRSRAFNTNTPFTE